MKKGLFLSLLLLPFCVLAQYNGTGAVTQGPATTTTANLYTCANGRIAGLGTITATDNSVWTVPAVVNFTNSAFPFASNLHNACTGTTYANAAAALAALDGSDIVDVDPDGQLITAFIFADNYFEMYINGVPVGKDNVPYTQFNSNIVRFRVKQPFTIAMLLVDWEEHLGLGSEASNGFQYHDGDGGMVAVFKDAENHILATTGNDWKAQTFYTSPITDLSCPTENGSARLSNNCSTQDTNNGAAYYGLHWNRPANWMDAAFDDSDWPDATTYANATIGVDNKPAYTNFTNIFDDTANDAQFIWSANVILDNEVIVRHTVQATPVLDTKPAPNNFRLYPNPAQKVCYLDCGNVNDLRDIRYINIFNCYGALVYQSDGYSGSLELGSLPVGAYFVKIETTHATITQKLMLR